MTFGSKLWLAVAGATCLASGPTTPASAWDTAPWNPLPFDQPSQLGAGPRAKIAKVEAEAMARARAAGGGGADAGSRNSGLVTDGPRGCDVSLGGVVLPQGARGSTDIVTNVQVEGDVITVCR